MKGTEIMMWNFKNQKDREAVFCDDGRIFTYRMLEREQKKFFQWMNHRTLIFIIVGNNIESLTAYVSCIKNRVIPLLLSEKISEENLLTLINTYAPEYLWMPSGRAMKFYDAIVVQQGYTLWENTMKSHFEIHSDISLLLMTSGTTGSKKLVKISYQNLYENTRSIIEYLKITREDRTITTLPMNYTFGLSIINTYLEQGASIILTAYGVMHPRFWKCMERHPVTSFSGVPYTYELLKKIRFDKKTLPTLKVMTQAGGKMSLENQIFFGKYAKEKQILFYIMYGQTEATARMSYLPPDLILTKKESIGIPIPGGKFFLRDESGKFLTESFQQGELVYTGANVSMGYAESRNALKEGNQNQGLLSTGDLAYRDEDGCYYITGRKNRFTKIYGLRINLDELEQMIYSKTGIEVFCVSDDKNLYVVSEKRLEHPIKLDGIPLIWIVKKLDSYRNENKKLCYMTLLESIRKDKGEI